MNHVAVGLGFSPLLPVWALAGLAALCVAALAVALVRRARGKWVRAALFVLLVATLAGPRLEREVRTALPDVAIMLVDRTASMGVGRRADWAAAAADGVRAQVARMPGVELREVDVPEAGQDGTRLFAALDRARATVPAAQLSAVLAVTDGQAHDTPVEPLSAPLDVLLTGAGEEHDRRLRLIDAPEYGVVGGEVAIKGVVEDLGDGPPAGSARLRLTVDGAAAIEQDVAIGEPWTTRLPITREGPAVVEIMVDDWAGEASTLNNRVNLTVNGVRDRLRVLLVSGEPTPGERTWRRLLKSDPSVDLVHFTILRSAEKDDLTPIDELALITFPTQELFQDKIRQFDLIIFDQVANRGFLPLPYLRNVANYVQAGGALLVEVGPEFASPDSLDATPLRTVLPAHAWPQDVEGADMTVVAGVREGAFKPIVTAIGQRHPVTEGLSQAGGWGPWYRRLVPDPNTVGGTGGGTAAAVMATPADAPGGGGPLLMLDHVGRGRVAMLLSDQAWLWSRGHDGGGPQAELLRRVAHWLMRQPALEEERLSATLDGVGETSVLHVERRSLSDVAPPTLTVTAPDGRSSRLAMVADAARPGRAAASMPAAQGGVWRLSDGTHVAFAATRATNAREFDDLRATALVLGPQAAASGGGVAWLVGDDGTLRVPDLRRTEPGRRSAGVGWIGLPMRNAVRVSGRETTPLLPAAALLPILLVAMVLTWIAEAGWRPRRT